MQNKKVEERLKELLEKLVIVSKLSEKTGNPFLPDTVREEIEQLFQSEVEEIKKEERNKTLEEVWEVFGEDMRYQIE